MDLVHSPLLPSQGNLALLWMFLISVLAPVMLARVLCRGTWKEIAQAYGIWLALWFLFGLSIGLGSQGLSAGFMWAVMLGVLSLLPILGIPILVLLIKLASFFNSGQRVARGSVPEPSPMVVGDRTASPAIAHRPFVLANIRNWSWATWVAILGVCVFLAALKIMSAPSDTQKQQLRTQFHLPDDVALSRVYVANAKNHPPPAPIEGYAQLSEAQLRKYVADIASPNVWRPSPIMHGGTEFHGPYAADALVWRDLNSNSPRNVPWGSVSYDQAQNARNGLFICFTVRDDGAGYRGMRCPEAGSPIVRAAIVQGFLDFDTRTLHMLIRQTRPPGR